MERQVEKPAVTVSYYTISDVMTILGCKRTKAQDVVRELNDELEEKGFKRRKQGTISNILMSGFTYRRNLDELFSPEH